MNGAVRFLLPLFLMVACSKPAPPPEPVWKPEARVAAGLPLAQEDAVLLLGAVGMTELVDEPRVLPWECREVSGWAVCTVEREAWTVTPPLEGVTLGFPTSTFTHVRIGHWLPDGGVSAADWPPPSEGLFVGPPTDPAGDCASQCDEGGDCDEAPEGRQPDEPGPHCVGTGFCYAGCGRAHEHYYDGQQNTTTTLTFVADRGDGNFVFKRTVSQYVVPMPEPEPEEGSEPEVDDNEPPEPAPVEPLPTAENPATTIDFLVLSHPGGEGLVAAFVSIPPEDDTADGGAP